MIIATHSLMQHPVGFEILENGKFILNNLEVLFTNIWLWFSYFHNQAASMITSSFAVSGIGAFYILSKKNIEYGNFFKKTAVFFGLVSSIIVAMPTGDLLAKNVVNQHRILAAMEGIFHTEKKGAEIVLIGQSDVKDKKLDNKILVPNILSFLTYGNWNTEVKKV